VPDIDPSLRHVPKLDEAPADCDPVYRCQLCRRRGTLQELLHEECKGRSGVMRRMTPEGGPADVEKPK
jgi:hypothetical protein